MGLAMPKYTGRMLVKWLKRGDAEGAEVKKCRLEVDDAYLAGGKEGIAELVRLLIAVSS